MVHPLNSHLFCGSLRFLKLFVRFSRINLFLYCYWLFLIGCFLGFIGILSQFDICYAAWAIIQVRYDTLSGTVNAPKVEHASKGERELSLKN